MKYCPVCKSRMPSDAANCTRCGGALRTIGGGVPTETATAEAPAGADAELSLQLAGLQHAVAASRSRMVILGIVAAVLTLLFLLLMTWLHFQKVFEYAEVAGVAVEPVPGLTGIVHITLQRTGAGKIELIRTAGSDTETLVDHGQLAGDSAASSRDFEWGTDGQSNYSILIRYRQGWGLVEKNWTPPGN